MDARYQTASDVLDAWRDDIHTGKAPTLFPCGVGELAKIEIGPGLVTLIGGAPGAGKSAFTMQLIIDALRLSPELRACVCNVEMPPLVLLDRQLARVSGVDLTTIRHRRLTAEHAERIDAGIATLEAIADRLAFVRPPFDLENTAATVDAINADVIVLDYLQRIRPPGDHADGRTAINATMDFLRQFADQRKSLIVVSAVGRTKDSRGRNSYTGDGLNLASFKESGELEYGADDAYIIVPGKTPDVVVLRQLKSRYGECGDLALTFDKPRQRFSAGTSEGDEARQHLAAMWNETAAADANEGDAE
ncbi:MAG: DnaB-like helicase C-terminal domain-containing protein [Planctomycetota bacterium]